MTAREASLYNRDENKETMTEFAQELAARLKYGEKHELATYLGKSRSLISTWLNGDSQPTITDVKLIAKYFHDVKEEEASTTKKWLVLAYPDLASDLSGPEDVPIQVSVSDSVDDTNFTSELSSAKPKKDGRRSSACELITRRFVGSVCRGLARAHQPAKAIRILIVGAGEAGTLTAERMLKQDKDYVIVGFVDNDEEKQGLRKNIAGRPISVLGQTDEISRLVENEDVTTVLISMPSAPEETNRIQAICTSLQVICYSLGLSVDGHRRIRVSKSVPKPSSS